jgi:hypothetical protein
MKLGTAVRAIEQHGVLLVYPIANREGPKSLWSVLYPGLAMNWAWDEAADPEVAEMWRLRERLADSGDVVYAKWYQGRATFFSKPVFTAMLARLRQRGDILLGLGRGQAELLGQLEENSPVSTKELRAQAMETNLFARRADVDRAMSELWKRLLVVGVGEVDDGAFPSLSVGATSLVFEPLWLSSQTVTAAGEALLDATLARAPLVKRQYAKVLERIAATTR